MSGGYWPEYMTDADQSHRYEQRGDMDRTPERKPSRSGHNNHLNSSSGSNHPHPRHIFRHTNGDSPRNNGAFIDHSPRANGSFTDNSLHNNGSFTDHSPRNEGYFTGHSPRGNTYITDHSPRVNGSFTGHSPRDNGHITDKSHRDNGHAKGYANHGFEMDNHLNHDGSGAVEERKHKRNGTVVKHRRKNSRTDEQLQDDRSCARCNIKHFLVLTAAWSVRLLMIAHNLLAVWRVVISREDWRFWALAFGNVLTIVEGAIVVQFNGGMEWKWWCPCFLSYILTTLPSLWLLQLSQYDLFVSGRLHNTTNSIGDVQGLDGNHTGNTSISQLTTVVATVQTPANATEPSFFYESIQHIMGLPATTWIVVLQEFLVYLIVFGRWVLPRDGLSRMALSSLLLEFLGKASDIMELYALFDEPKVQSNLGITYGILALWSMSFLQFIPILIYKPKNRKQQSPTMPCITRNCGEHFSEMLVTLLTFSLQDCPFLCLRLYIIYTLNLITYSLVFFVLKNIVTILLLGYRFAVLCVKMPCCKCRARKGRHRRSVKQDLHTIS